MNRAKLARKPVRYAALLSTRNPVRLEPDPEQLRLRAALGIPSGQRVPSRQARRPAMRVRKP